LAAAQSQNVNIPDTPSGHTLKAWLDAFNSGERATEEKYFMENQQQGLQRAVCDRGGSPL
jgi:hypothetical protein